LVESLDLFFELKFEINEYQEINDRQWALLFSLSLRLTMKGVT
jgi:hypothetical protein